MKIAIPLFGSRVSPRFEFSPEIWIVTVENGEVVGREKLPVSHLTLGQRMDQLALSGVHKVICGGIDGFCMNQLASRGIEVIGNVIGEAETAFDLYMKGRLRAGFFCDRRRTRSCVRRRGPGGPWWKEESNDGEM